MFEKKTGCAWSKTEIVNVKELTVIFYSLKSFKFDLQGKHVKTFLDNTTAEALTNQMGTCKNHALKEQFKDRF